MQRSKRKLSNSNENEVVDENEDHSASQPDIGHPTSNALTEKVNDMVRYLLATKQRDCPVLKSDLIKYCLNSDRSNFDQVFENAVEKMKDIFGIDARKVSGANKISYVLVNNLKSHEPIDNFPPHASADPSRVRLELSLLYPILMFIRLRHPETKLCPENILLNFLKTLRYNLEKNPTRFHQVHRSNKNDDLDENYGAETLKKLLYKDWVQKSYLKIVKTAAPDGTTTSEIGWGEKAEAEVHLDNAFARFCHIYQEGTPDELKQLQEQERAADE